MAGPWVSFAEVKGAVSMRRVLEDYGVLEGLRGSGQEQYRGGCPIHRGEGRDAFHAHLGKNAFHCFSCGAGGNVLDLIAALEQCSLREAALRLQRRFGGAAGLAAGSHRSGGGRERGNWLRKKERGMVVLFFPSPAWMRRTPMCRPAA